jgi:hypothetical protein
VGCKPSSPNSSKPTCMCQWTVGRFCVPPAPAPVPPAARSKAGRGRRHTKELATCRSPPHRCCHPVTLCTVCIRKPALLCAQVSGCLYVPSQGLVQTTEWVQGRCRVGEPVFLRCQATLSRWGQGSDGSMEVTAAWIRVPPERPSPL